MPSRRSWRCWSPDVYSLHHQPPARCRRLMQQRLQSNEHGARRGVSPMTDKSNFTPEEWKLLLESVMMAGIAVTAADPSGLWGMLKESTASGRALVQAQLDPRSGPLIKAVVADFETPQGQSIARDGLREKFAGRSPAELNAQCIE